jgi:hypothetical protein
MTEQWKPIPDYEGFYEVSDQGRVRGVDRTESQKNGYTRHRKGTILRQSNTGRYFEVNLCKGNVHQHRLIHHLVAAAFIGPRPKGMVIRHMDGNSFNNSLSNLSYGTQSENLRDWPNYGGKTSKQKLTIDQVREIRDLLCQGYTLRGIASRFGVAHGTINAIKQGRTFSYI